MIRVQCPICSKRLEIGKLADLPSFPFCSERCRLVDLGRWIDGAYSIPAQAPTPPAEGEDDAATEDE
jgi:endogenous inhibitor of DNA gyrase (YacG/DUF329 family)